MLLASIVLAGCQPYVQGNGVYREQTRDVPAFDAISVTNGIQLEVTAGAAQQSVKVTGDENVIQHIDTSVVNDVLQVKSTIEFFDSTYPVRAVVAATALHAISAAKASPVKATGVASPTFSVDASDGVDMTLAGAGGATLDVRLSGGQHGGAKLDAQAYPVDTATVALQAADTRALLAARVRVSGTAVAGSSVQNTGAATCVVEAPSGVVSCTAP